MHEFTTSEIAFYALCWAIAFLCAFCRTLRDDEFRSYSYGISLGATSGFFAFGAVAILLDNSANRGDHTWYYLGVAALVGLLAKEQDRYARVMLAKVLSAARMVIPEDLDGPDVHHLPNLADNQKPKDDPDRELHS